MTIYAKKEFYEVIANAIEIAEKKQKDCSSLAKDYLERWENEKAEGMNERDSYSYERYIENQQTVNAITEAIKALEKL